MRPDGIRSRLRAQRYGICLGLLALVIAVVGPANAATGVSSAAGSVASALKLAKSADKRSREALKVAKAAGARSGPQGPQGPAGAPGPAGEKGATGPSGGFTETLPSGKTLRGLYSVRWLTGSAASYEDAISFGVVLPSAPQAHFISTGSNPNCPGNSGNPQADPGHLCVYEASSQFRGGVAIFDANFSGGASTFGARVIADSTGGGSGGSFGSWAVTAP